MLRTVNWRTTTTVSVTYHKLLEYCTLLKKKNKQNQNKPNRKKKPPRNNVFIIMQYENLLSISSFYIVGSSWVQNGNAKVHINLLPYSTTLNLWEEKEKKKKKQKEKKWSFQVFLTKNIKEWYLTWPQDTALKNEQRYIVQETFNTYIVTPTLLIYQPKKLEEIKVLVAQNRWFIDRST